MLEYGRPKEMATMKMVPFKTALRQPSPVRS
jgi:hypothetical protein